MNSKKMLSMEFLTQSTSQLANLISSSESFKENRPLIYARLLRRQLLLMFQSSRTEFEVVVSVSEDIPTTFFRSLASPLLACNLSVWIEVAFTSRTFSAYPMFWGITYSVPMNSCWQEGGHFFPDSYLYFRQAVQNATISRPATGRY